MDCGKFVVRELLDILIAHGVKEIVCSPGTRNAPILIAAEARKSLKKHIVIDERCAGFIALGIAQVSQKPVALVCTSGTALLNYAPAVAEAYYQGLPLIVISADRPKEWIDQDDSQTIRQFEALRNIVKDSYDISDREMTDKMGWYENRIFNDAMLNALRIKQGPVHINIRLSPPLDSLVNYDPNYSPRIIRTLYCNPLPSRDNIKILCEEMMGRKIMIVAGFMEPDNKLNRSILRLRQHPNVVVMAETISNLHLPAEDYAIDSVLAKEMKYALSAGMRPDLIISLGGALVSRMLKQYLRQCAVMNKSIEHWHIGFNPSTIDCFQTLSLRIEADPGALLSQLSAGMAHLSSKNIIKFKTTTYFSNWFELKRAGRGRIIAAAQSSPWCELKALAAIFPSIPDDWNIFLSNGTIVRYAQLLMGKIGHANFCNRGVSGIEGSTSTALGGALAYTRPTLLISGDMSFAHDLTSLTVTAENRTRLNIIVINNGGGGIFRFVSSTRFLECREKYLCVNPEISIRGIAENFGFEYMIAENESSLWECLAIMKKSPDISHIIEVITPPEINAAILCELLTADKPKQ